MDASNTTWANLFPATNRTKLPAVAQKLDGDKFADNQTFFAVRAGQRVLQPGHEARTQSWACSPAGHSQTLEQRTGFCW